jgi:hypothetical protein
MEAADWRVSFIIAFLLNCDTENVRDQYIIAVPALDLSSQKCLHYAHTLAINIPTVRTILMGPYLSPE